MSITEPREADRFTDNNQLNVDVQAMSRLFTLDPADVARAGGTEVSTQFELSTLLSTTTAKTNEGAICDSGVHNN